MTLTIIEQNGQLVVDSRLIAEELGITHKSFKETIRTYQDEIEESFGALAFLNGESTGGRPDTAYLLTEDQATYIMTLSRNSEQVRFAKRNLVKAFSAAKSTLRNESGVDKVVLDALLSKVANIEALAKVSHEYLNLRKYATNALPGLNELNDAIVNSEYSLPSVRIEFTASEWIERNAAHLSKRQRNCFYSEIAAAHRFLVGIQPRKENGTYVYSNKHEIIFERAKYIAETMIPLESSVLPKPKSSSIHVNYDVPAFLLSQHEQSLLNIQMKLKGLLIALGFNEQAEDIEFLSGLGIYVKGLSRQGVVQRPNNKSVHTVTATLILCVKKYLEDKLQ